MSSLCFKFLLIGKSFSTKTKVNFEIKDKVVLIGGFDVYSAIPRTYEVGKTPVRLSQ
jgi:hypothetical protein